MEDNKLQGRTVIAVPNRNGKRFAAMNEGVELVSEAKIQARKDAIKARNKSITAAAKAAAKKRITRGSK